MIQYVSISILIFTGLYRTKTESFDASKSVVRYKSDGHRVRRHSISDTPRDLKKVNKMRMDKRNAVSDIKREHQRLYFKLQRNIRRESGSVVVDGTEMKERDSSGIHSAVICICFLLICFCVC